MLITLVKCENKNGFPFIHQIFITALLLIQKTVNSNSFFLLFIFFFLIIVFLFLFLGVRKGNQMNYLIIQSFYYEKENFEK